MMRLLFFWVKRWGLLRIRETPKVGSLVLESFFFCCWENQEQGGVLLGLFYGRHLGLGSGEENGLWWWWCWTRWPGNGFLGGCVVWSFVGFEREEERWRLLVVWWRERLSFMASELFCFWGWSEIWSWNETLVMLLLLCWVWVCVCVCVCVRVICGFKERRTSEEGETLEDRERKRAIRQFWFSSLFWCVESWGWD